MHSSARSSPGRSVTRSVTHARGVCAALRTRRPGGVPRVPPTSKANCPTNDGAVRLARSFGFPPPAPCYQGLGGRNEPQDPHAPWQNPGARFRLSRTAGVIHNNVRRRRSGSGGTPASSFPARPPPPSTGREGEKTVEERTLRGKVTGLPSEKNGKTGGSSRRPCLTHCPSPSRPPARGASGTIYHKNPDCPGSATVAAPTCVPQKRVPPPARARSPDATFRRRHTPGHRILRLRR